MKFFVASASLFFNLATTTAFAESCVTDVSKFEFMESSGQQFYFGSDEDVRAIYQQLEKEISQNKSSSRTSIFFAQGNLKRIFSSVCDRDKCTAMDIFRGLEQCSSVSLGPSESNICHPLAAVYKGKLYCLLSPALSNYSDNNPFRPFNPYSE